MPLNQGSLSLAAATATLSIPQVSQFDQGQQLLNYPSSESSARRRVSPAPAVICYILSPTTSRFRISMHCPPDFSICIAIIGQMLNRACNIVLELCHYLLHLDGNHECRCEDECLIGDQRPRCRSRGGGMA